MAAVRHLWQAGREAVAFSAPDFLEWLRSGYKGEADIAELLTLAQEIEVLAVDDFGAENATPWCVRRFSRFLTIAIATGWRC